MTTIRIIGSIIGLFVMATCQYNRGFDGQRSFTGAVTYELPRGYSK